MYLVTGASGQLGRLIIKSLQKRGIASNEIIAAVRTPAKVQDLADEGVVVRQADYTDPASLAEAFKGVKRAVLVSSSEVGQRFEQHSNVINAAKSEGIELLAYTSLLNADTSPLALAQEHKATEALLNSVGLPHTLLRNSWYLENYTDNLVSTLEHNAVLGAAKDGKYSAASRKDYAEAAAVVITSQDQAGKTYELAGDSAFTLTEYAAKVSDLTGKTISYVNQSEQDFANSLIQIGLPEGFAKILADSDTGASNGALFDDSKTLSTLIGRGTTTVDEAIRAAL